MSQFKKGMYLEVIDKKRPSRMRLAKILENKGGRLRLKYEFTDEFDDFWCHAMSSLIHPVGWSAFIGHDIAASQGTYPLDFQLYNTDIDIHMLISIDFILYLTKLKST